MLVDAIKEVEHHFHPKVKDALDTLLTYSGNFNRCKMHIGVNEFFSKNCSVAFGVYTEEDKQDELYEKEIYGELTPESLLNDQFASQFQNHLYCGDTKNLLSILTQFQYEQGEEYLIVATPDSWCKIGKKAYIDKEMLDEYHSKDREVRVYVKMKQYVFVFRFKERIS